MTFLNLIFTHHIFHTILTVQNTQIENMLLNSSNFVYFRSIAKQANISWVSFTTEVLEIQGKMMYIYEFFICFLH